MERQIQYAFYKDGTFLCGRLLREIINSRESIDLNKIRLLKTIKLDGIQREAVLA
jgi:hypothetical protein